MKRAALYVAGTMFGLVALAHLARLLYHFPIIINAIPVPDNASWIGLVVAAVLSFWMFRAAKD